MAELDLKHVVVAGGTGLVGRHLLAALLAEGARVTVLTRTPATARLPEGAEARPWTDLPGALAGADAVINLCGEGIADRRWSPERKRALLDSRMQTTLRLTKALGECGPNPPALINASAIGIYGTGGDEPLTEASPAGTGFLADLCRQWEAAADGALAHGARVVKLRIGIVLAREGGALPKLALPVKLFQGTRLGSGRQGFSWIHMQDLVQLFLRAARDPAWSGAINATAPGGLDNEGFTRAVARRLHRPLLPVPAFVTRAALRLLLGEMAEEMLLAGPFVKPARAEALGFRFRFPEVDAALADLL